MLYDLDIINKIKDTLTAKQLTLSVAESVTAGHLQAAFSAATEASKFFEGGLTAYNAGQKCRHLNVEPIKALDSDCVTECIACEMAKAINNMFLSDYGIAITGYATRMPEKGLNDLYAYFAIANKQDILTCRKLTTTETDTVAAQVFYTNEVIRVFKELISPA